MDKMKFKVTMIDSSGRKQGTFLCVEQKTMILNVIVSRGFKR